MFLSDIYDITSKCILNNGIWKYDRHLFERNKNDVGTGTIGIFILQIKEYNLNLYMKILNNASLSSSNDIAIIIYFSGNS